VDSGLIRAHTKSTVDRLDKTLAKNYPLGERTKAARCAETQVRAISNGVLATEDGRSKRPRSATKKYILGKISGRKKQRFKQKKKRVRRAGGFMETLGEKKTGEQQRGRNKNSNKAKLGRPLRNPWDRSGLLTEKDAIIHKS